MRIFVTGAAGKLGYDIMRLAAERGTEAVGSFHSRAPEEAAEAAGGRISYVELDITDRKAVERAVRDAAPDAVIHCAAFTAVDAAERPEGRRTADAVNRLGTLYTAEAAKAAGAKLIYISTDYVFDGSGDEPREPDDRRFGPLNVYGRGKLAGEEAAAGALGRFFIVRTSWVFGLRGGDFVKTMIKVGRAREAVRVVNDQIGSPTYSLDLASLLLDMAETERYGYYHAAGSGAYVSRAEFCREIFRQYGLAAEVIPVSTKEYGGGGAERPLNSRLDCSKLAERGFSLLSPWQDALGRFLKEADL